MADEDPTTTFCESCGRELTEWEKSLCESSATKYQVDLRYHHMSCFSEQVKAKALEDKKVLEYVINQANICRLSIFPIVGTKRQNADHWFDQVVKENADKSFSEISLLLGALEGASAACQFIANNIKKKQNILDVEELEEERKNHVKARDSKKLADVQKKREKETEKKVLLSLTPEEADKFKKDQKQIETFTKLGMSKQDAMAQVQKAREFAEARAKRIN